ncbi:MAG: SDR family oxidoreductase [Saprospiraceae bacterium]|nr:SDR family oxidoreductase [Saprospiraceae bacterium]
MHTTKQRTALITGASRGLGFALAEALAQKGWHLLINGRNAQKLLAAQRILQQYTTVEAISGDLMDEIHLIQFPERLEQLPPLELIVNNASTLGASPQPQLLDYAIENIHHIFHTNVIAPLSLLQKVRPFLSANAQIINISSDAAVQAYAGWGGYGASKAALDHLSAILAEENPDWKVYALDPGDIRTQMHQEAFPGQDLSDLPLPADRAVPALLRLIQHPWRSGRYTLGQLEVIGAAEAQALLK